MEFFKTKISSFKYSIDNNLLNKLSYHISITMVIYNNTMECFQNTTRSVLTSKLLIPCYVSMMISDVISFRN